MLLQDLVSPGEPEEVRFDPQPNPDPKARTGPAYYVLRKGDKIANP